MPYADRTQALECSRRRYAVHREEDKARRKADYFANHEAEKATRRAWYAANREKMLATERARQYRILYNLTVPQYETMLASQGGVCAICGADKPSSRKHPGARYHHKHFAVDHCHKTGRIRGLLCVACNVGLGRIEAWYHKHEAKIVAYLARP